MTQVLPPPVQGVREPGPRCNGCDPSPCFCHDETQKRAAGDRCTACGCHWVPTKKMPQVVLVVGNLSDGYRFIGPFQYFEDACAYSDSNGLESWVATLEPLK